MLFKTTKCAVLLKSDVQVAPLSRNSMVNFLSFADTFIEIYLKNNIYNLRCYDACFILFLRNMMMRNLSYLSRYVQRDRSCCTHGGTTFRTEYLNPEEISLLKDVLFHMI